MLVKFYLGNVNKTPTFPGHQSGYQLTEVHALVQVRLGLGEGLHLAGKGCGAGVAGVLGHTAIQLGRGGPAFLLEGRRAAGDQGSCWRGRPEARTLRSRCSSLRGEGEKMGVSKAYTLLPLWGYSELMINNVINNKKMYY